MDKYSYEISKLKLDIKKIKLAIDKKELKLKKRNKQLKQTYIIVEKELSKEKLLQNQNNINTLISQISKIEKEIILLKKSIIEKDLEIEELIYLEKAKNKELNNSFERAMETLKYEVDTTCLELPEKITVLFIASNPQDITHLTLDEEIRELYKNIREAKYRDSIDIKSIWATRSSDLMQSINEHNPTIIHFSGHGSSNGELILQDDNSRSKKISIESIIDMFNALPHNIKLIVFNTCFSEHIAKLITKSIPFAIGMNNTVSDLSARIFSSSFYSSITFGHTVEQAFLQAKVAIKLEGLEESDTPQIYVKDGVDANEIHLIKHNTTREEMLQFKIGDEEVNFEKKLISFEKDIIKIKAYTHMIGIRAEYEWIKNKYPKAEILKQSLTSLKHMSEKKDIKKNIHFDIIKIEFPDKRKKEIYFDISDFMKDGATTSTSDSNQFFMNKLEDIYSECL